MQNLLINVTNVKYKLFKLFFLHYGIYNGHSPYPPPLAGMPLEALRHGQLPFGLQNLTLKQGSPLVCLFERLYLTRYEKIRQQINQV